MATKQQIFRNTLLLLKEPAIGVTVSDDTRAVNNLNVIYDVAFRFVLESGKWNFAARSLGIEADTDVESTFGLSYAFEKPSDYVNLIKIAPVATFYPPFGPNQYADEVGYWFANCDPIWVSYVSIGNEYGGDISNWPQIMARALEFELAYRIAPVLTSLGEEALAQLERRKDKAMAKAKSWDASKQPPEPMPPARLSLARRGSLSRTSWR